MTPNEQVKSPSEYAPDKTRGNLLIEAFALLKRMNEQQISDLFQQIIW